MLRGKWVFILYCYNRLLYERNYMKKRDLTQFWGHNVQVDNIPNCVTVLWRSENLKCLWA